MTREKILRDYKVDEHGVIRSPGKFEAEMLYAPYFYDIMMEGGGEREYPCDEEKCEAYGEDGCEADECPHKPIDIFQVTEEDVAMFPELEGVREVHLEESDQGFVYVTTIEEIEEKYKCEKCGRDKREPTKAGCCPACRFEKELNNAA